jgi:hypothetical protein
MKIHKSLLLAIIFILSVTVIYYIIRIHNLNKILETPGEPSQLRKARLEDKVISLKVFNETYIDLSSKIIKLAKEDFSSTQAIPIGTIKPFIKTFQENRAPVDKTETILFDFPEIIKAMIKIYKVTPTQWTNLDYWNDKALVVYPANYGPKGDLDGNNVNQTTSIVQLAQKDASTNQDPDDWVGLFDINRDGMDVVYNFGDLRPPKNGTIKP